MNGGSLLPWGGRCVVSCGSGDAAERWAHIPYYLGVDVGTTYTAAAIWRDGRSEVCSLGGRAAVVPSVVFLRDDGELVIGEAAERRAVSEPARAAREFKRRVGDSVPVLLGGSPFSADALMAKVLRWTVDQVAEREGGPPAGLVVSHPANWGPFKQDLLRQSIGLVELAGAGFVAEPEAAAIHYAVQERTAPGTVVAVYDLGGGTFDAAVLRRRDTGWEMLGQPRGIERLGGIDFDEAVFQRIRSGEVGAAVDELDPDEPATWSAIARLRRESVAAKEALASDTAVDIPVLLPNLHRDVRLTRSELEDLLRPSLLETVGALKQAVRSAEVEVNDLDAVLLVGGSSRIPLVAEIVGAELGRPVAIDVHPKHAVALGAAIVAARDGMPVEALETTESPDEHGSAGELAWVEVPPAADEPTAGLHESEPQGDETTITLTEGGPIDVGTVTPAPPGERRVLSRTALVAAVAAVVIGGAGAAVALANRTDTGRLDRSESATTTEQTSTTAPPAIPVPDVVGLTEQQARDRLAQAGLRAQVTAQPTTDADEDGIVLAQDPPADQDVDRGASVRFTVGDLRASPPPTRGRSSTPPATATSHGGGGSTSTTQTTTPLPTTTPTTSGGLPSPTTTAPSPPSTFAGGGGAG